MKLASEGQDFGLLILHGRFQFSGELYHLPQFALKRERTFTALLASGNRHIVETLAAGGKEPGIRVFQSKVAGNTFVRGNVSIAQLGKDDFQ